MRVINLLKLFIGIRKFVVFVLYFAVMIAFRLTDQIDGAQFSEQTQLVVVAYMGANLGVHGAKLIQSYFDSKGGKNE